MIKPICAILFFSLTFISVSYAQNKADSDKGKIISVCDKFMERFRDGNIAGAIQLIRENSKIPHERIDTLQKTMFDQMKSVIPEYGSILSYEFIMEKKIKDFLVKRFYVVKYEKHFLKFEFVMYKSPTGWIITSFNYNENINELWY